MLDQTYEQFEVIVVDDHSTDDTVGAVKAFDDDRVELIRLAERHGANTARNVGIRTAVGERIAFLDADDYWKPEKLANQLAVFDQTSDNLGVVYTGTERRTDSDDFVDESTPEHEGWVLSRLHFGNFIGTFSCIMVTSSVFEEVGPLKEGLPSWQDWEFYLRAAEAFQFGVVPATLTVKTVGRGDAISRDFDAKVESSFPTIRKRLEASLEGEGRLHRRRALARLHLSLVDAALVNSRFDVARPHVLKAGSLFPFEPRLYLYLVATFGGQSVYRTGLRVKRFVERAVLR